MSSASSDSESSRSASPEVNGPDAGATAEKKTFADLGVTPELCAACTSLGFKNPTDIQVESIPPALEGRDIIGIAQTGSGKTAAFTLPILQNLWENPQPFYALILAPTRELADQISKQVSALGAPIGVRSAVIVGGMDMMSQSIALSKRPHVIVATPGRLMDHLENTKGFSLKALKYLVLDEADRLLDLDFGPIIDKLLKVIPKERNTFLFSATLSTKVEKLKRASLNKPVQVKVAAKYSTVSTLQQYYVFFPEVQKDAYLFYLVNELSSSSMIIFTGTVDRAQRLSIMLNRLGFAAIPLHGQMSQSARLGSLNKFKSGGRKILVATDVASRGLDIPLVDLVINYDIPTNSKDYVHRVGRTARAGRSGKSITLTTQYDVVMLKGIEAAIGRQLPAFDVDKEAVAILSDRVAEAGRAAKIEMREQGNGGSGGARGRDKGRRGRDDDRDRDDDVVQGGMPQRKKFKKGGRR
ncbi:ribosomal RNA processing protein [Vanrija albida]|uniref:Ribosomal RNA processing protein n=1 Tax=Vanrija albida TaxID=181172 RepID=A0ABR3QDC7_9TREE